MKETGWKHLPCPFCDVLAFENGSTYGGLVARGAIREHKMIRHFGSCPEVNPILSSVVAPKTSERIRFDRIIRVVLGLLVVCTHVVCLLVGMVLVQGHKIVDLRHLTHLEGLASELVTATNRNAEELRGEVAEASKRNDEQIQLIRDEYGDAMNSVFRQLRRVDPVPVKKETASR